MFINIIALGLPVASLEELCWEAWVKNFPQTAPQLVLFNEHFSLAAFYKLCYANKLAAGNLKLFFNHTPLFKELDLSAYQCAELVDDKWLKSLVLLGAQHTNNLQKIDLSL